MANEQNDKTVAVLSYITIVGWLIAYFAMHKDQKSSLGSYHLRQTLLLYLCAVVYQVAVNILTRVFPPGLMMVFSLLSLVFLVLWIIGLIAAINGEQKPMPFIGDRAQSMFPAI